MLTGFLPTNLITFLRHLAKEKDKPVQKFLTLYRGICSRSLWWPTWNIAHTARYNNKFDNLTGYSSDDTLSEFSDSDEEI